MIRMNCMFVELFFRTSGSKLLFELHLSRELPRCTDHWILIWFQNYSHSHEHPRKINESIKPKNQNMESPSTGLGLGLGPCVTTKLNCGVAQFSVIELNLDR